MTGPASDERTRAERRATYRALATDATYRLPKSWICADCGDRSPLSATRCRTCDGMTAADPSTWRARSGRLGQAFVEYALILAIVAIGAIIALLFLGGTISHVLSAVGSSL